MSRDLKAQLTTARMLLAQFIVQIDEFEGMNREQRRTPRGRRTGYTTWTDRVADLEAQVNSQPEPETP